MAKSLVSDMNLVFFKQGSEIKCRADYIVTSDDLECNRSLEVLLTPTQQTQILNFVTSVVIPAVKAKESIV